MLLLNINWILLRSQKLAEIIFHPSFSIPYQEVLILIGTAFLREEDREGSYLELDANRWKCEV